MSAPSKAGDRIQAAIVRGLAALPPGVLRLLVGRPVHRDGQTLDVETQLVLKLLALAGEPELEQLTPEGARGRVAADAAKFAGRPFALERVEHVEIPGPDGAIRARLYVPRRAQTPGGLLVYFHGGGFVVGDLDTHDNSCRFVASQAELRVLSIDYRLAPEHRFPAALDDAVAAFRFAAEHGAELGVDPARIAVGGDSAGGNLAAGVALATSADSGPAPAFQLLLYPWLDLTRKSESYRLFGEGFYLTEADLDWYCGRYLDTPSQAEDPLCSPLLWKQLKGVAPAYVATAGFDPLRDEGEAYAGRLLHAGVPVVLRRHQGLVHGFFNTVAIGHAGREAVVEAVGALRVGLAAPARRRTTRRSTPRAPQSA